MTDQLLTPNQQLWVILGIFIVIAVLIGFAHALLRRQLNDILSLHGGTVIPLWKAALRAAQAILTHPHPFAAEADALMREAAMELETRMPMPPERSARLEILLFERISSKDPNIRPGEVEAAAAYPYLRRLALFETLEPPLLTVTETQMVSTQRPDDQSEKKPN